MTRREKTIVVGIFSRLVTGPFVDTLSLWTSDSTISETESESRVHTERMRYFIYCRKSSEAEDRQVASIESQLTTLKRTFGERHDIEIVRVFEEAYSAKAPGRPVFSEMVAEIEKGRAEGIVAWAPDCLARNSVDGGRIIYLLDTGSIKDLKFATYTFENGSQGKFMLQIMFGQSKYYSDALSENVKRGNRTKLEKGWRPNHAPLGYRNDPVSRTIVNDPERFDLIRRMFEEILAGTPVSRVRNMANDEWGFRTPLRKRIGGKPITLSWVYKVLRNPFYAGLIPWAGKIYPGKHEPIVTIDEFERAQAIIRKRGKAKPKTKEFAYTGMIRCGECGMLVTAEDKVNRFGSHYTYYHCTKRRSDYHCSQRCIRVEQLEEQIEAFLTTLTLPSRLHTWALARMEELHIDRKELEEARRKSLERLIADTDRALDTLTSLRLRDLISDEKFVVERQKLEMENLKLQEQLKQDTGDASEPARLLVSFSARAAESFRSGDAQTKRRILDLVGSNLLLKDRTLNIEAKKPLRQVADISNTTQLRAAMEDIRSLYVGRDPEFMAILDNIRRIDAMHGSRSADGAGRPTA